jgi:hypothetical protein
MVASSYVVILSLLAVGAQIAGTVMVYHHMKGADWGAFNFLRNDWPSRLFSTVLVWFGFGILLSVTFVELRGVFYVVVVVTLLVMLFWLYREYRAGRAESLRNA